MGVRGWPLLSCRTPLFFWGPLNVHTPTAPTAPTPKEAQRRPPAAEGDGPAGEGARAPRVPRVPRSHVSSGAGWFFKQGTLLMKTAGGVLKFWTASASPGRTLALSLGRSGATRRSFSSCSSPLEFCEHCVIDFHIQCHCKKFRRTQLQFVLYLGA